LDYAVTGRDRVHQATKHAFKQRVKLV